MTQTYVVPNIGKLCFKFPDVIFALYQQMTVRDSLSFAAVAFEDTMVNVTVKKDAANFAVFEIATNDFTRSTLCYEKGQWTCRLSDVTGEMLLVRDTDDACKTISADPNIVMSCDILSSATIGEEDTSEKIDKQQLLADSWEDGVEILLCKNKEITVLHHGIAQLLRAAEEPLVRNQLVQTDKLVELPADACPTLGHMTNDEVNLLDASYQLQPMKTDDEEEEDEDHSSQEEESENSWMHTQETHFKAFDPECNIGTYPIVKEGDKFKCSKCGMMFIKQMILHQHMRYVHKMCTRSAIALCVCNMCGEGFIRKSRLDEHIAHKHSIVKPFSCDVAGCKKKCKTMYNLRDHKRIYHYNMTRYACDLCNRKYENYNMVLKHRKRCISEDVADKTPGELKNPDWIPVEQLFFKPPIKRLPKEKLSVSGHKTTSSSIASSSVAPDDNETEDDPQEETDDRLDQVKSEDTENTRKRPSPDRDEQSAVGTDIKPIVLSKRRKTATATGQSEFASVHFAVHGILSTVGSKSYTINESELARRIYGPETLTAAVLGKTIKTKMSLKGSLEGSVQDVLHRAGFQLPQTPTVLSVFTKLTEGEISDLLRDLKTLQEMFLPLRDVSDAFLNYMNEKSVARQDILTHIDATKVFLRAFSEVHPKFTKNVDLVTHSFACKVIMYVLECSQTILQQSEHSIQHGFTFYTENMDENDWRNNTDEECSRRSNVFAVPPLLSNEDKPLGYCVTIEEIERRFRHPEQLALTVVYQLLAKAKGSPQALLEALREMGLNPQLHSRSGIKSCFTLLTEDESLRICGDFSSLMKKFLQLEQLKESVWATLDDSNELKELRTPRKDVHQCIRISLDCLSESVYNRGMTFDQSTHVIGSKLFQHVWSLCASLVDGDITSTVTTGT